MGTTRFSSYSGRLKSQTTNLPNPLEGDEYFNTSTNSWMRYNGTQWKGVALDATSTSTSTTTSTSTSSSTTTTSTSSSTTTTTSTTTS